MGQVCGEVALSAGEPFFTNARLPSDPATRRCERTCSTKNSSLQPSEAHASCCVSAILATGSTVMTAAQSETGATACLRRCARPSSLIWVVTTPRSVSIAAGEHCLLGTAFPAVNPDLRSGFLQVVRVRSAIGLPPGPLRVVGNDTPPATADRHRQPGRSAWRPQPVPPSSSRTRRSRRRRKASRLF